MATTDACLMMPGSMAEFSGPQLDSHQHPLPTEQVEAILTTRQGRLHRRLRPPRMRPVLAAEKAAWAPAAGESLLEPLATVFEPIMLAQQRDLRRYRLPRRACDGLTGR